MDSARPFRAFVSYCHKDKAFAAWLQRRLEGYRLPRRLADKVAPLPGQAPGRIGPVFRDREDLSASTDLSAAVREAIAASSALVVVASPDAAKSHWVEREIALFRQLHPEASILVALATGEPAESMPEALRTGPEPLAADFRKQGDGKRLAFLKIVAGLADLPLDTLVQRDAQRQLRRVTGVTTGAAVLVLVMAMLLVAALRAQQEAQSQRTEAERQRASAEGLVEYMLTDLRERLKGVGRIDVMAGVNARAMEHYRSQGDLSRLPDESLERRARILHAMGEDDEKGGNFESALAKFQEARRTTAAIRARSARDGDAIYAHAQSEYWVGYAAWRTGDLAKAAHHWRAYLAEAKTLANVEPEPLRSRIEQGYAEGNLCDLQLNGNKNLLAAEHHCAAAVGHFRAARAAAPADAKVRQDLANRLGWLSRVQLALRRYELALSSRTEESALLEELLRSDSQNAEYQTRRCWPDIGRAEILIAQGRSADAAALLKHRWSVYRPLMLAQKNSQYWETGIRILLFLSKAERRSNRDTEQELLSTLERYVSMFPHRKDKVADLKKNIG
jgi:hypothetical protein